MGDRARGLVYVVVAAVMAVSLGACSSTERLTATELAAKGNVVCADSDKKLRKVFEEELGGGGDPTPKQMQAVLRRVVPIVEGTVTGLRSLEPPKELQDKFEDALGEAEEAILALRKGAASAEAAQALFSAPQDPFAKANKGLESVGIGTCSQGGGGGAGAGGAIDRQANFVGDEYRYAGPSTVSVGMVTIILTNEGEERHEMNIVRLKEGVSSRQVVEADAAGEDTDDLVADDEVGGVAAVDAGATGKVELNLVPGTYGYACFVDAPDGQPHVAKGMCGEFTVA